MTRWRSDEYDRAYDAADHELDPVKRAAHFIRMNDLIVGDRVVVPLISRMRVTAAARSLRAPLSGFDSDFYALHDWYRDA